MTLKGRGIRACQEVRRHEACNLRSGRHSARMSNPSLKLAATGLLAAGSSPVAAAIIVFDIDPNVTLGQPIWFEPNFADGTLNTSAGTANQSPFLNGRPSFGLSLSSSELDGPTFLFSGDGISAGGSSVIIGTSYVNFGYMSYPVNVSQDRITSLALGTEIRTATDVYAYDNIRGRVANFNSGTSYVALIRNLSLTERQYGWLELTGDGSGGIVATRFAFDTQVNAAWVYAGDTGAVPEPSALGFVGGLFGLVAAAHLRRRQLKKPAASDKFLALAAGEKLN